jgi:hypothetical protein
VAITALEIRAKEVDQRADRLRRPIKRSCEFAPALIIQEKEPLVHEKFSGPVSSGLKDESRHAPAGCFGCAANKG